MTLEEFVNSLNLDINGKYNDNSYTYHTTDSDEFSNIYLTIEEKGFINVSCTMDEEKSSNVYDCGDGFSIQLLADYTKDDYEVIINKEN